MDSLNTQYRDVVEKTLKDYANFLGSDHQVQVDLVFDREGDRYNHILHFSKPLLDETGTRPL